MASALDRFLDLFRVKPPSAPDINPQELNPSDYQSRREAYPQIPLGGWDANSIQQMRDQNSVGNFQMSELFYQALVAEPIIGAALDMRRESMDDLTWALQCPKYAPDEMHIFTEALARDWQSVMPDAVRGEIVDRANMFGFQISRVEWTRNSGQKQPRLIPYTHSNIFWRPDLGSPYNCVYQGLSELGIELISNDGREWVIFTLGGTRPWLKGMIRKLAFVYWALITGEDRWLNFNDQFAEPIKKRTVPLLQRKQQEPQRDYTKVDKMRGGNTVLCPKDEKGYGYDFEYEQVDAQGYETLEKMLERFDDRAAIIILGHNILQSLGNQGGSRAALGEARKFLRTKACADSKILSTGCESLSKVWARANFGMEWDELQGADPQLAGQMPESVSWSQVFDLSDPDAKQAAAVQAAQYSQGFATFTKGLQAAGTSIRELEETGKLEIDWEETAERCGIAMMSGEDSYSQDDIDEAELDGDSYFDPPAHVKKAAQRSLEWVRQHGRGATPEARGIARKILRGRLTRSDLAQMASYFDQHKSDQQNKDWANLKRPSSGRIAWGLWGDSGNGSGRKWVARMAAAPAVLNVLSSEDLGPGVMIALFPRPDEAEAVRMDGGEELDELHVTLGYLGRAAELPPKWLETLHSQAGAAAQQSGPLVGTLGGLGRFSASASSDGRDVIYATPNVIGLVELRQKLASACAAAGVPFRANHGFTPHMTLAYVDPGAPMPVQRFEPMAVHFDSVWVCAGPSRWEFPLSGATLEVLSASNEAGKPATSVALLLASGDPPDSAAGFLQGQQQVDQLAEEPMITPGLAAILAALAAAADWTDLRQRLVSIVREQQLSRDESELAQRVLAADHIGEQSVDHDLSAAARAEVDAADRQQTQTEKLAELRARQERSSILGRAATSYAVYAVSRHLWDGAATAEAQGQPLELYKAELGEALTAAWGPSGALWDTAKAEPLQRAFTHARARRLDSPPLRAIYPYWQFLAILDGATSPICRKLGNPPLVRPAGAADFPIPPLHWRCRSTVRGLSRADGEAQVSAAPAAIVAQPGFGDMRAYPEPTDGPPELLSAYRTRAK